MKLKITFLILVATGYTAVAQQRPLQSLYMFDPLLVNPAYAGTQVQLSGTAIYRNQWLNLEGAPKTFTTTLHSGFRKYRVGLGLIASKDVIGIHDDTGLYGVYSYKIPLSKDNRRVISFGIQGGFNFITSDYNKLSLKNGSDPNLSGVDRRFNPNVGAGIYYRDGNFYGGFSVPYMLNNKLVSLNNVSSLARQKRYYYLFAGYNAKLTENITLVPSTLIRIQEQAPVSFDLNALVVLYQTVGLGVSYRLNDAVVGLFELQINNNFHVGYAYDFTTSKLNQFSNGSHELMVNYRIRLPKIHKGLECPAYW
ncbi:MAG: type IX secretion system membrane protein PorP/SprF [Cyclobacteriaceae bacterium]|nr:type IX secretion system membrane protein PorP/SprF [Cyclobacteriaceae bacterium]